MVGKAIQKANAAKIIAVINTLETACEMHYIDTGRYASEYTIGVPDIWNNLTKDPGNAPGWNGPYIKKPLTRSDNPYRNHMVVSSSLTNFDLDGDGTVETFGEGNYVLFMSIPEVVARRVNDAFDGPDGSGWAADDWQSRGRVELSAGVTLNIYLLGGD